MYGSETGRVRDADADVVVVFADLSFDTGRSPAVMSRYIDRLSLRKGVVVLLGLRCSSTAWHGQVAGGCPAELILIGGPAAHLLLKLCCVVVGLLRKNMRLLASRLAVCWKVGRPHRNSNVYRK